MSYFRATMRDELRQTLGLGKVPVRPGIGAVPGPAHREPLAPSLEPLAQPDTARDPILDFAHALERYDLEKVLAGFEQMKQGRGIDNLVDQANLDAAKAAMEKPVLEPMPMHQPIGPQPMGGFGAFYNNPFTSVPGM